MGGEAHAETAGRRPACIDESTGIIDDADGGWSIHGAGGLTVYSEGRITQHVPGDTFSF